MKKMLAILVVVLMSQAVNAQQIGNDIDNRWVRVASIYSITRLSNPRMGAFGEIGAVSDGFYFDAGLSQNPASLATNNPYFAGSITHNPEKSIGTKDVGLTNFKGFYTIGQNDFVGLNFGYYNLGKVYLTDELGNPLTTYQPFESLLQGSWAHQFSEHFVAGASLKFIHTDYGKRINASSIAIDLGLQWKNRISFNEAIALNYSIGLVLNDFGSKLNYGGGSSGEILPTNLRLGVLFNPEYSISEKLKINIDLAYQVDKLLAPTPPYYKYDDNGSRIGISKGYDPNISSFRALYQSFYDAPGGKSEELDELIHKFGLETRMNYEDKYFIAFRLGKVMEHEGKGFSRKSFGFGLGAYGFTGDFQFMNYQIENYYLPKTTSWVVSVGYRSRIGELFKF